MIQKGRANPSDCYYKCLQTGLGTACFMSHRTKGQNDS